VPAGDGNPASAIAAARAAIAAGRAEADPRRYGEAEALLGPWWEGENSPDEVMVLRAIIRQANHEFTAAAADLDAVLRRDSGNAQARLTRAFLAMATGHPDQAADHCRALPPKPDPLIRATCLARALTLSGEAEPALGTLAAAMAAPSRKASGFRAFALSVEAEALEALGRQAEAEWLYRTALAGGTSDVQTLASLADLLLDRGRPGEVLDLLREQGEADVLVLRRAIAARRAGDPGLADWSSVLRERFAAAAAAGNRVHLREEARFLLEVEGDAAGALALASENWRVQKEPADARLLLECALAANQPKAAKPVVAHIAETGFKDERLAVLLARLHQ
jgi:thioredoxin-like negative regulator of GroEL